MKSKYLFLLFFSIALVGSSINFCYGKNGVSLKVEVAKDLAWERTIEFLVLSGFQIKTIDFDSGVIFSEKSSVNDRYISCKNPGRSFKDQFVVGKATKLIMLNSREYFSVFLGTKNNFSSTNIKMKIDGTSQWGPIIGIENPIESPCLTNGLLEKRYISYVNSGDYIPTDVELETGLNASDILYSDDFDTIRSLAREIYENDGVADLTVYDRLEIILIDNYKSANDELTLDALSWICKALTTSNNKKYIATLEMVASEETHKKLRGHAQKSLSLMR